MPRGRRASIDLQPGTAQDMVDLLRRLAHVSKLDKASVAQRAELSRGYVSDVFNGRKAPAPDTAVRLVIAMKGNQADQMTARRLAEQLQDLKEHRRTTTGPQASERHAEQPPDRWGICMSFVVALDTAHNELRAVARGDRPGNLLALANSVFQNADVYAERERLLASAGRGVAAAGEAAFFALVEVRNAVRTGADLDSSAYHDAYHDLNDKVWRYRLAVRAEFGQPPLSPQEVHRADWSDRDRCARCGRSAAEADGAQASPVERAEVGVRVPQPALRQT